MKSTVTVTKYGSSLMKNEKWSDIKLTKALMTAWVKEEEKQSRAFLSSSRKFWRNHLSILLPKNAFIALGTLQTVAVHVQPRTTATSTRDGKIHDSNRAWAKKVNDRNGNSELQTGPTYGNWNRWHNKKCRIIKDVRDIKAAQRRLRGICRWTGKCWVDGRLPFKKYQLRNSLNKILKSDACRIHCM